MLQHPLHLEYYTTYLYRETNDTRKVIVEHPLSQIKIMFETINFQLVEITMKPTQDNVW